MNKLDEAKLILKELGMPEKQQSDIAAYTLLALAEIKPHDSWEKAINPWIRIHDVLQFVHDYFNRDYAENTRETIRKDCMHQFRESALIEDNGKATNSPNYRYRITMESLQLLQKFGSKTWKRSLNDYMNTHESLIEKYAGKRQM